MTNSGPLNTASNLALRVRRGSTRGISESLREVGLSNLGRIISDESGKPGLPDTIACEDDPFASGGMEFVSSGDIGNPRSFEGRVGRLVEFVGLYVSLNVE